MSQSTKKLKTPPLVQQVAWQRSIVMTPELERRLDDWRRKQDSIPSRAEAIRRLLDQALSP